MDSSLVPPCKAVLVGCHLRRCWEAPELCELAVKTELKKAKRARLFPVGSKDSGPEDAVGVPAWHAHGQHHVKQGVVVHAWIPSTGR